MTEKSKTLLFSTLITVVGTVVVATITTTGTIAASKSGIQTTQQAAETTKGELVSLKEQSQKTLDAILLEAQKTAAENQKQLAALVLETKVSQQKAKEFGETVGYALPPAGTILAFAGPPDEESLEEIGWLVCNGNEKNRKKYSRLYGVIGDFWGKGDGINSFNLPDLRGLFLRGADVNGKNDPDYRTRTNAHGQQVGAVVGSIQGDQFQSHKHNLSEMPSSLSPVSVELSSFRGPVFNNTIGDRQLTTVNTGGSETRPKNVYVYYIIKY